MTYNTAYLINTAPGVAPCAHCHAVTLCGLDYGLSYKVDPAPLNLIGELHARLRGRRVYRLIAGQVTYREREHLNPDPPVPVLAEHRCTPIDPEHIAADQISSVLPLIQSKEPDLGPMRLTIDPETGTLRPVHAEQPPPF